MRNKKFFVGTYRKRATWDTNTKTTELKKV